ncbi:hypothetical protein CXB51_015000 [Gossypium anomalum]|uniref:RNase H type-1 domain-containing protein n=1 Tax=Gossypium anomalum TaxID=47600 RepID=A0A8J6D0S7_9ROSI|nr:hypothetical protein CXB51_015000 [Gossypium anomalum]
MDARRILCIPLTRFLSDDHKALRSEASGERRIGTIFCLICEDEAEIIEHVMRDCRITKETNIKNECIREKKDGSVLANFIKNYLRELDNLSNKLPERREEIQMGLDLGIRAVEVEEDSLTVVKKAQMNEEDRFEISAYRKDAKRLSKEFHICIFMHASRSANGVTHLLATEGIKRMEHTYLMNGVPSFANAVVELD